MESTITPRKTRPIISDTGTGWLKIVALVMMFVDHSGKMLFGNLTEMRILGRMAFPIYAWCLVVGFHYTKSLPKYLLRIALVGLISQPLYMMALRHTWLEPNIFLTLLLALSALWGIEEKKWGSHIWAPAIALVAAVLLKADYGWRGVLLILLLYAAQQNRASIAAIMIAFSLFWGSTSSNIATSFGGIFQWMLSVPGLSSIAPYFLRMQTFALLSLPLILVPIPREKDLRLPKWVGYAIYPGHLLLLYLLERIFL